MTWIGAMSKVVDIAVSHLGKNGSDGSNNVIIDRYNGKTSLPIGYNVAYADERYAFWPSFTILVLFGSRNRVGVI